MNQINKMFAESQRPSSSTVFIIYLPSVVSRLEKEATERTIAILIATPFSWYVMSKWLNEYAYQMKISWWIFAFSGGIALAIAVITVSFYAIKAARKNPVKSLRTE